MIQSFVAYIRMLHFTAPEALRRYFRLFGDLEYDLLALRAENRVMTLRVREVKRRMAFCRWISEDEERRISVTSHELAEHYYARMDELRLRMASARSFRYDRNEERQGMLLLADIAHAILGVEDAGIRSREQETLERACDAYARLDLMELQDLHELVQNLLAHERREQLDESEEIHWRSKLHQIGAEHPLPRCARLDDPAYIQRRTERMKRKIQREQDRLEQLGLSYTSAIRALRFRN